MYSKLRIDRRKTSYKGTWLSLAGITLMIAASFISYLKLEQYYLHLLRVVFEPAGWFLLWMGLDFLVYYSNKAIKEIDFYSKMKEVRIEFQSY
jgi:hypothetical protein